jgi:predicted DNA-binding transcriptional regulator YafY
MTKTERLFALAEHLRSRRTGITAGALADRFGVTVRTIHRDLEALRNANMPISSERGRGGGFSLDAHYTLPPVNITAREAAVLLILLSYADEMRLVPFRKTLDQAEHKIRAALSTSGQRELARRLKQLSFVGVPAKPLSAGLAAAVEQAWFEQSPLALLYGEPGSTRRLQEKLIVTIRNIVLDRSETRLNVTDTEGKERQLRMDLLSLP